jgi:glutaredoxin
MENQAQSGQDLSQLKSMFADYQKKQSQSTTRTSREDILAKYFVPRKSKEIFRILPPKAGKKHFEEAFFHVLTTNAAGGKKKHGTVIYCPAHNDPKVPKLGKDGKPILDDQGAPLLVPAPCPACAEYKRLIKQQDPSIKGVKKENMTDDQKRIKAKNDEIWNEARKWQAKKFYIVRGIDKGQEKDGVKFWRFKHNYKNQGTLDRLLPVLEDYMTNQQADFTDPQTGTDLNIIMTDAEFNGHVYKQISAITTKGKSPLHGDPTIMRAWLDDDISWRDVFKPKKVPNITPYEYLQMCVAGTTPYWEDSDQNNKHWVFPGRPDLEEKANTRTVNLDNNDEEFEQASDLEEQKSPRVTISNITESKVGEFKDDASDIGKEAMSEKSSNDSSNDSDDNYEESDDDVNTNESDDGSDYDDLPF